MTFLEVYDMWVLCPKGFRLENEGIDVNLLSMEICLSVVRIQDGQRQSDCVYLTTSTHAWKTLISDISGLKQALITKELIKRHASI